MCDVRVSFLYNKTMNTYQVRNFTPIKEIQYVHVFLLEKKEWRIISSTSLLLSQIQKLKEKKKAWQSKHASQHCTQNLDDFKMNSRDV